MASRPWGVSKYEIPVKPEPSLPRGSQNWLGSCYKQEYPVTGFQYFQSMARMGVKCYCGWLCVGWAWGAWDNINDALFTSQAVTIFYMDVGDVETVKWLQYLY